MLGLDNDLGHECRLFIVIVGGNRVDVLQLRTKYVLRILQLTNDNSSELVDDCV